MSRRSEAMPSEHAIAMSARAPALRSVTASQTTPAPAPRPWRLCHVCLIITSSCLRRPFFPPHRADSVHRPVFAFPFVRVRPASCRPAVRTARPVRHAWAPPPPAPGSRIIARSPARSSARPLGLRLVVVGDGGTARSDHRPWRQSARRRARLAAPLRGWHLA